MNPTVKAPDRDRIAADLAAWLKAGNRIQRIPVGVTGDQPITQPPQRRAGGRPGRPRKAVSINARESW